ncbi:lysoplasmalogenase [Vibrio paucivorans]|uniref:Lysoplasmalogenase n=1 Tax=Vibrio paucivorans TaxID=2829489 RepID=A0A9X3CGW2_9VIBR|nr:lysoplasmalogenase [Vibrio paucivorans]MCW8335189.1 lysoplasmalogenase [Vibrio paucivorans]
MWLLITLIAAIHIVSINNGPRWLFYLSKPLPILLMIGSLVFKGPELPTYVYFVISGLTLSALGDVFLMHPKDKFIQGLSSFLLAHIAYFVAFHQQLDGAVTIWVLGLLVSLGVIVYLLLLPNLGEMKLPVAAYVTVILAMTWAAIEYRLTGSTPSSATALVGACLFMLSDLVLAIDRFRSSSRFSQHVIMVTYYTAQLLITMSAYALIERSYGF